MKDTLLELQVIVNNKHLYSYFHLNLLNQGVVSQATYLQETNENYQNSKEIALYFQVNNILVREMARRDLIESDDGYMDYGSSDYNIRIESLLDNMIKGE